MTTLASELRALCALLAIENYPNQDEVNSQFFSPFKGMTEMYALQKGIEAGVEFENARLAPLIEKLILCVEAAEKVSAMKVNCIASFSEEFRDGSHTAFCQAAEPADEALAELRAEVSRMKEGK